MMKRWKTPRVLALVACWAMASTLLGGCYTMRAPLPGVTRSDVDDRVEVIGSFDFTFSRGYTVWGYVGPDDDDQLAARLEREVAAAGGDGVANLIIETWTDGWDAISRVLTLGYYTPRTYRVHGDIVRIHAPAVPGQPLLHRGVPAALGDDAPRALGEGSAP